MVTPGTLNDILQNKSLVKCMGLPTLTMTTYITFLSSQFIHIVKKTNIPYKGHPFTVLILSLAPYLCTNSRMEVLSFCHVLRSSFPPLPYYDDMTTSSIFFLLTNSFDRSSDKSDWRVNLVKITRKSRCSLPLTVNVTNLGHRYPSFTVNPKTRVVNGLWRRTIWGKFVVNNRTITHENLWICDCFFRSRP